MEKSSLLEDYGVRPVPEGAQKNWFQLGIVYWGSAVCLPAFLVAGLVAGPSELGTAVSAFIIGAAVLAVIAILIGTLGARTKLSTGMSARFTFGTYGANVLQIILFLSLWGWFGVQLGFMVAGLGDGGLYYALGKTLPIWLMKVIGGILMTLSAVFGFKAIERLSVVAIPLLLVIIVATIASVYSGDRNILSVAGSTVAAMRTDSAMPLGAAISIVIGAFIVGALVAPDITRYAKSPRAGAQGMAFGMFIGFPAVLILGAIMIKGTDGEMDFSKVMIANNTGCWVVLAVIATVLAAWTTNDNNLYSGALSLNALFPKVKKWLITALSGVVGTVLSIIGINTTSGFQTFLGIIAILIPPAASVMIIDYYFFRGERNCHFNAEEIDRAEKFRAISFISWMFGSATGFVMQYASLSLTSVTAIDTMLTAGVIFSISMLVAKK